MFEKVMDTRTPILLHVHAIQTGLFFCIAHNVQEQILIIHQSVEDSELGECELLLDRQCLIFDFIRLCVLILLRLCSKIFTP